MENPGGVANQVINAAAETGRGFVEGDPGAIATGFATATEVVGGGGVLSGSARAGRQIIDSALDTATKGINKTVDRTGQFASSALDTSGLGLLPIVSGLNVVRLGWMRLRHLFQREQSILRNLIIFLAAQPAMHIMLQGQINLL